MLFLYDSVLAISCLTTSNPSNVCIICNYCDEDTFKIPNN